MATDPERAAARLDAFRLVEAVQVRDVAAELAAAHAVASERDWPEVTRVLVYAEIVRGLMTGDKAVGDTISRLHDSAAGAGDQAMLSAALASRAEHNLGSEIALVRQGSEHDLARATALLEFATGPALERATAYVACAVAYNGRELWELEEELYAAVTPLLAECEIPLLDAVVEFNRAEASLKLLCGVREVDEVSEIGRLARAAHEAVGAALSGSMPTAWKVEVEVFGHLASALAGGCQPTTSASLEERVVQELSLRAGPVTGLLRLADALCAVTTGDWEGVPEPAERAEVALSSDESVSPARALALRLAAQAEAIGGADGAGQALRYAEFSARRRWDSRMQMVGSARSSLQTEHLRIERDRHARAAQVDDLTGLANRRAYSRHLQALRRRRAKRPLAALLVDIDSFKSVNDNHGHAIGDEVLARVASTLSAGTRPDDLVARLGGDEFVALLDDLDVDAVFRRATDILERLAAVPWASVSPGLDLAVSIGVAAGLPGGDPEELVRRADSALYAAKRRGGGTVEVEHGGGEWERDPSSRVRRPDRPWT